MLKFSPFVIFFKAQEKRTIVFQRLRLIKKYPISPQILLVNNSTWIVFCLVSVCMGSIKEVLVESSRKMVLITYLFLNIETVWKSGCTEQICNFWDWKKNKQTKKRTNKTPPQQGRKH